MPHDMCCSCVAVLQKDFVNHCTTEYLSLVCQPKSASCAAAAAILKFLVAMVGSEFNQHFAQLLDEEGACSHFCIADSLAVMSVCSSTGGHSTSPRHSQPPLLFAEEAHQCCTGGPPGCLHDHPHVRGVAEHPCCPGDKLRPQYGCQ